MTTDIYTAIHQAADEIEARPELFNFGSVLKPNHECGTPGCAVGWIAFCLGASEVSPEVMFNVVMDALGLPESARGGDSDFYARMDEFAGMEWVYDAALCARALRAYAEKYHAPIPTAPTPLKSDIPESIRALFQPRARA